MQPYQEASQEVLRQKGAPFKAASKAIGTGLGLAGGNALFNKIAPLLSKYIPDNIAIRALSKIDPRLGKFLDNAIKSGYGKEDVEKFIKEKSPSEQPKEEKQPQNSKDNRNIVEQYSPELHQFLANEVSKGRPILDAGALAQVNDKFKNIIKKLESDHKTPFSTLLQTIYGGGQYGGPVNPSQSQQSPQQSQGQAQQPGQGQQRMSDQQIMQMISEALKL